MKALEDYPLVMRPEEVAEALRCGRSSVYEAIRRGDIRAVRLGRRVLVPRAALEELLGIQGAAQPASVSEESGA